MSGGGSSGTPSRPVRRVTGDPYGIAASRPFLTPILALAGLVVVGLLTLALLTGDLPFLESQGRSASGPVAAGQTPSPSSAPNVNPDVGIDGRLVYAKAGNLWIQEGTQTRRLTSTGRDSQPAWAPDGTWVYFIDTRTSRGRFPWNGTVSTYDLRYPVLSRIRPDGTDRQVVLSGLYKTGGSYTWFSFLRDPAVSPDGTSVAVVSDGPDPTKSDVVLGLVNVTGKKLLPLKLSETAPYGHQDPAWRPDGRYLLYVVNAVDGGRGTPTIWRYEPATKKTSRLTGAGYLEPQYSPDARSIVATKTSSLGTDIVVLDATTGNELLRVTRDGRSWGATWSPDGTQVAFLHLEGTTTDLQVATLSRDARGAVSVKDVKPLTEFSGLDADSRPAWWGPRPTPTASASPSTSVAP